MLEHVHRGETLLKSSVLLGALGQTITTYKDLPERGDERDLTQLETRTNSGLSEGLRSDLRREHRRTSVVFIDFTARMDHFDHL